MTPGAVVQTDTGQIVQLLSFDGVVWTCDDGWRRRPWQFTAATDREKAAHLARVVARCQLATDFLAWEEANS